jgi:glycosyltransferase involved in cell wall biosynthesis
MKISVIIPVYNGERWVAQCIENMLGQSYKNLEVIVVDDGSTDGSAAIAAKYPVKLIRQANGGVSAARNAGIDAATGEYIHFMDVDDLINIDYYERMVEAVLCTDADMAFGGMVHEATTRLTRSFSENWLATVPEDRFSITGVVHNGCCVRYIIRKSLLESTGLRFEVGRSHMEDILFSIKAVHLAGKVVTVPGTIYYYKDRSGSAMTNRNSEAKRKRMEAMASGNAIKKELLQTYGLSDAVVGIRPIHKFKYKLLGIPTVEKRVLNNGKTRWYLFGVYVMQKKQTL